MKKAVYFLSFVFLAGFTSVFSQQAPKELVGHWKGAGKIIVSWCESDSLSFDLSIAEDGNVKGVIGDAEISNAKLESRSALMEALGNGEFIIEGGLRGALLADEGITRESFTLMFDLENGNIVGGFHSSGSKFGGKEKMVLTVSGLKLKRAER